MRLGTRSAQHVETHFAANAAGMFAERTNDAVTGLDRALRKEGVPALCANGRAFLLELLIHKRKQLEKRHPDQKSATPPDTTPRRGSRDKFSGRCIRPPKSNRSSASTPGPWPGTASRSRQFPLRPRTSPARSDSIPAQPAHGLRKHFQGGDHADHRPLVIASAASMNEAAAHARRKIGRHHIQVGVDGDGCPGCRIAAGNPKEQVGAVRVGFFRRKALWVFGRLGEMQQGIVWCF